MLTETIVRKRTSTDRLHAAYYAKTDRIVHVYYNVERRTFDVVINPSRIYGGWKLMGKPMEEVDIVLKWLQELLHNGTYLRAETFVLRCAARSGAA